MGEKKAAEGKLGFIDSIAARLGRRPEPAGAEPPAQQGDAFGRLEAEFAAAIRELDKKVEEHKRVSSSATGAPETAAVDRAAARQKRVEEAHRAVREDIEKIHAQLGTGLGSKDLDALADSMIELEKLSAAGRDSHDLLPRARFSILNRLLLESGELAVARLVALMERAEMAWPDPNYWPRATPEQVERSQLRRRAEVREAFLVQGPGRTAERVLGIVSAWGSDYPDRESPLWKESVLEGVAAGIRARLLDDFVAVLRADRELLLGRVEDSIGKQVTALQGVVQKGVRSIEQANQAVASSLRALDQLVPEIAWQHVLSKLPQARGEFGG
jgi:hypothetical protein